MSPINRLVTIRNEVGVVLEPFAATQPVVAGDAQRETAQRVASLDGQVLAVIDNNTNPRLTAGLVRRLAERFRLSDVITVVKDTVNVPPRPEDWQMITNRATVGLTLFGS